MNQRSHNPQDKELIDTFTKQFVADSGFNNLSDDLRRGVLVELVRQYWGELPSFSTLKAAEISVIAKATVGTGVVPVFMHPSEGRWYAVVQRPGTHYKGPRYAADINDPYIMIAGGFINLSKTEGIPGLVEANDEKAEHPNVGALRELTEEIVNDRGEAILLPHPDRLLPMDALTLSFPSGEKRVVIGYVVQLNNIEIEGILNHIERVSSDDIYRRACRNHTVNSETGQPEICRVVALPLDELAANNFKLLHPDQRSLFTKISRFLSVPKGEF